MGRYMVNFACNRSETLTADPDRSIAEAVLAGDTAAYSQLVERYRGRIYARVHALLNNHEDAEEVTQDAFVRALQRLDEFRWEASFSTWLYQIASNLARNRYWHRRRRGAGCNLSLEMPIGDNGARLEDFMPDHQPDPAQRLNWREFTDEIERHLDRIPDPPREIMSLRLMEHLSYEEIAEALQIPVGTVKSRIARARGHLNRGLGLDRNGSVYARLQT